MRAVGERLVRLPVRSAVVLLRLITVRSFSSLPFARATSLQSMEDGRCGRTGRPATCVAGGASRNAPARALTPPLSTGVRSVRACRCRRAPAMLSVQVILSIEAFLLI